LHAQTVHDRLQDMPMECQAAVAAILPQTFGTLNVSESLLWVDLKCGSGFSSATGTGASAPNLPPVAAPAEQPAAATQGDGERLSFASMYKLRTAEAREVALLMLSCMWATQIQALMLAEH
jgi:hypothetical protein